MPATCALKRPIHSDFVLIMKLFHTDFKGKTIRRVIAGRADAAGNIAEVCLCFTDGTEIMIGVGEGGILISSPVVKGAEGVA